MATRHVPVRTVRLTIVLFPYQLVWPEVLDADVRMLCGCEARAVDGLDPSLHHVRVRGEPHHGDRAYALDVIVVAPAAGHHTLERHSHYGTEYSKERLRSFMHGTKPARLLKL